MAKIRAQPPALEAQSRVSAVVSRQVGQGLLRQNKGRGASKCAAVIRQRRRSKRGMRRRSKREVVCKRYALSIEEKERHSAGLIAMIDKKIAKLRAQPPVLDAPVRGTASVSRPQTRSSQSRRSASRGGSDFATTGRLTVQPPEPIQREGDIGVVEKMTVVGLAVGSPRSSRADALLKELLLK
jgi:hypothetical protein